MRSCPNCAHPLQDEATVCQFCGRDLQRNAAPLSEPPRRRLVIPWVVGAMAVFFAAAVLIRPGSTGSESAELRITGGFGAAELDITSQETERLTGCSVTVTADGKTWTATLREPIEPRATVRLPWSAFEADGQTMPGNPTRNGKRFTVQCEAGPTRRSIVLRF